MTCPGPQAPWDRWPRRPPRWEVGRRGVGGLEALPPEAMPVGSAVAGLAITWLLARAAACMTLVISARPCRSCGARSCPEQGCADRPRMHCSLPLPRLVPTPHLPHQRPPAAALRSRRPHRRVPRRVPSSWLTRSRRVRRGAGRGAARCGQHMHCGQHAGEAQPPTHTLPPPALQEKAGMGPSSAKEDLKQGGWVDGCQPGACRRAGAVEILALSALSPCRQALKALRRAARAGRNRPRRADARHWLCMLFMLRRVAPQIMLVCGNLSGTDAREHGQGSFSSRGVRHQITALLDNLLVQIELSARMRGGQTAAEAAQRAKIGGEETEGQARAAGGSWLWPPQQGKCCHTGMHFGGNERATCGGKEQAPRWRVGTGAGSVRVRAQ